MGEGECPYKHFAEEGKIKIEEIFNNLEINRFLDELIIRCNQEDYTVAPKDLEWINAEYEKILEIFSESYKFNQADLLKSIRYFLQIKIFTFHCNCSSFAQVFLDRLQEAKESESDSTVFIEINGYKKIDIQILKNRLERVTVEISKSLMTVEHDADNALTAFDEWLMSYKNGAAINWTVLIERNFVKSIEAGLSTAIGQIAGVAQVINNDAKDFNKKEFKTLLKGIATHNLLNLQYLTWNYSRNTYSANEPEEIYLVLDFKYEVGTFGCIANHIRINGKSLISHLLSLVF